MFSYSKNMYMSKQDRLVSSLVIIIFVNRRRDLPDERNGGICTFWN